MHMCSEFLYYFLCIRLIAVFIFLSGQLSHWVCEACASTLKVILVDKGAQRYKFDTKMKDR